MQTLFFVHGGFDICHFWDISEIKLTEWVKPLSFYFNTNVSKELLASQKPKKELHNRIKIE